jgi:hypothetical protein
MAVSPLWIPEPDMSDGFDNPVRPLGGGRESNPIGSLLSASPAASLGPYRQVTPGRQSRDLTRVPGLPPCLCASPPAHDGHLTADTIPGRMSGQRGPGEGLPKPQRTAPASVPTRAGRIAAPAAATQAAVQSRVTVDD